MRRAVLWLVGTYVVIAVVGLQVGRVIAPPNIGRGPLQGIDDWVRNTTLAHRTPSMVRVSGDIANLGKLELLVPVVALITVVLLAAGLRLRAFAPALSLAGTGLLVEHLKQAIARPMPISIDPEHVAWPSGHTAGITAVVVPLATIAWVTWRWWWPSVVAAGFTIAMGTAMIVLNGHWLTDVIGGALIAGAWGIAVVVLLPDRVRAPTDSQAPRPAEPRSEGRPSQPPAWQRPAEWMS